MTVDVARACELIAGVTYKPGWTFRAEGYDLYHETIALTVEFDAPDTRDVPRYDGPRFRQHQVFYLHLAGCATELDLYDMVIECVVHFELHELREFFAVSGTTYAKPYHAHTTEGIANWRSRPRFETQFDLADVALVVRPVAARGVVVSA